MPQWQRRDLIEIVGVLAVVVSLIFVGMELAQNTAAVRAQTVQSVQIDLRNQLNFSENHAEISTKPPDQRTAAEALMRQQYFWRAMRSYENQWYHYSKMLPKLDPTPFLTCIVRPSLYKILWRDLERRLPSAAI